MISPGQISAAVATLAVITIAPPAQAAAIVPRFPQKERDLKKGLPPGTRYPTVGAVALPQISAGEAGWLPIR
jgi:hypothetical protein